MSSMSKPMMMLLTLVLSDGSRTSGVYDWRGIAQRLVAARETGRLVNFYVSAVPEN